MDNTPADELRKRRLALGFDEDPFAKEAGIYRDTVKSVEAGKARPATVAKYKAALERLERERGIDPPAPNGAQVEIVVVGSFGGRISARGPADDVDRLLKDAVAQLVSSLNKPNQPA